MDGVQVRYRSSTLVIGEVRAAEPQPIVGPLDTHQVVFSRFPVHYHPRGATPFVADPTQVAYLNLDDHVERRPLGGHVDHHVFLGFDPDAVAELQADLPSGAAAPRFLRAHGPADVRSYGAVWAVARQIGRRYAGAGLELEERLFGLVRGLLTEAHLASSPRRRPSTVRAHAQLVADVKQVVTERLHEPVTLSEVAAAVAASPYHVARVFREHTGTTIHAFQTQLRLARALEEVRDGDRPLTDVAVEHGFSHSSHFTRLFRRAFGTPPSAYRRAARRFDLDELTWLLPR